MGKVPKKSVKTSSQRIEKVQDEVSEPEGVLEPLVPAGAEWHVLLTASIFVAVYVKCTAASIPSGDAGDFILAAHHFGVAHPPGYPLYVTMGYLWNSVLPFGSPAYKLNLLTSIIGGLAATVIYLTTYKLTLSVPGAVYSSGTFAFSHLIWFHSVGAEIFSLNNLFCALLLLWVVRFQQAPVDCRARVAMEASCLSGFSMCNQHTSGLFIAVIGAWMFLSCLYDKAITVKQFVQTGVVFALSLIPYVQLPLSSFISYAPSSWGDHRTLKGFIKHVSREEYGTFRLTADDRPSDLFGNIGTYSSDLVHELGISTAVLTVCGVLLAFLPVNRHVKTSVLILVCTALGYILFFCMQANIDHSRELMKGVLERFWMQSNIVVAVLSGVGVYCIHNIASAILPAGKQLFTITALLAALAATANQAVTNYAICDLSSNIIMHQYGQSLLDSAPRNSVLMVEGDMPSLTSRYLRYCEGYRTDVDIVDQELIGFPWFKPMHKHIFKHYIFPHDRELYYRELLAREGENSPFTYTFADVFIHHIKKGIPLNIYPYMKHGDEVWKQHFDLWPVGKLYEVREKGNPYDLSKYIAVNMAIEHRHDLQHCDKEMYPIRSWEYVIAESCGHTSFFPPEHAHRLLTTPDNQHPPHDTKQGQALLREMIELYNKAFEELTKKQIDGTMKFYYGPEHNKNFGVAAYLIYTSNPVDRKYARIMVEQFNIYLSRASNSDKVGLGLEALVTDALNRHPGLLTETA